ncbi:neprilysin-1-like [Ixodes scapularis]|uniref:neprilysin-1-like n=1 Tax=Ixodes scapularis TaxID=6945 RepID=UPI001A9F119D|nr:neprilysin-1-like [Ixodes scapularis]
MRRREIWSSKHKFMIPHAQQLIAIWALYMIVEIAGLSQPIPSCGVPGKNVCRTDACKQRAKLILGSMNATEDPCTDFYAYVCGNWENSHPMPDDETLLGHHRILTDKAEEDIKPVEEEKKLGDLLQLLKKKGFTKWPILEGEATPYEDYNELLTKTGFLQLIGFEVKRDAKRVEEYAIYLTLLSVINSNLSSIYNEANISILSERSPEIKWLQILNNVFSIANITLERNETVIVLHQQYIYGIGKILKNTSLSTLYNYLCWTQIRTYGSESSKKFGQLVSEFDKRSSGVETVLPRWKTCLTEISGVLKHALIRLYVDKMFEPSAIHTVNHLVDVVNSTFKEMLENNTWMDCNTREEALKKLQKMIRKIGYPYWMLNDTHLNQLYEYVPNLSLDDSYLNVLHSLKQNHFIKYLQNLRQPYKREDQWHPTPAEVGAYYNGLDNSISFAAGILQPPFLQGDIPSSINMGALGADIGHEISHAFDNSGSQYDADGNLRNWWTPTAQEAFLNRSHCFVQMYNVTVKEVNMTVNGFHTLGENIADIAGLRAAYLAWTKFNDTEQLLHDLENLTGDQLFFVSYAHVSSIQNVFLDLTNCKYM